MIPAILNFIRREPALCVGLVTAALTLAAAFGLKIGDKEQAAIMSAVEIVLAVIIRSQVTPVAAPNIPSILPPSH